MKRCSLVAAALVGATLAVPATASAQTYTVFGCRTPDGRPASLSSWQVTDNVEGRYQRDKCPGGALELALASGRAHRSDAIIQALFRAPPDTEIADYSIWRGIDVSNPYSYFLQDYTGGRWLSREECRSTSGCPALGHWSAPFGTSNLVRSSRRPGVKALRITLTCGRSDDGNETCAVANPAALLRVYRADVVLRDGFAPLMSAPPEGPLVSSQRALAGVAPVTLTAVDRGGGVAHAVFEVDGRVVQRTVIDDNGGRCIPPYSVAQPCKSSVRGAVGLDTRALADGWHSLRIAVADATQTNLAVWGPTRIRTANGSCAPVPRSRSLRLRAVARGGKRAVTIPYGRRPRVRGRLTTPEGRPVPNAAVCVLVRRAARGAALRERGTTRTNARGRFSLRFGRGPSRRVYFVHRVGDGAVVGTAKVGVRAPVRLRAPRRSYANGERAMLRGRLGARPFPRSGVLVELQARTASGWQFFGSTRTGKRGRFRLGYRFTRTVGSRAYQIRARVRRQPQYPYATGVSRTVRVHVRG